MLDVVCICIELGCTTGAIGEMLNRWGLNVMQNMPLYLVQYWLNPEMLLPVHDDPEQH